MPTQKASIDAAQRKLLKAQLNALKPFRAVRETMPLQYVTAFLLVATEEHLNVSEYAKRAGTSQSLMTRHLADLGAVNRYHEGLSCCRFDGHRDKVFHEAGGG
jgi:hypothetical protein